jgi:hypothetical protein
MRKARNFLTQGNFIKTVDVVREMRADIESGKFTVGTLSSYLTEKMGFEISEGNVQGIVKALDIQKPRKMGKIDTAQVMELLTELEKRIARLEELAKAVSNGQVR